MKPGPRERAPGPASANAATAGASLFDLAGFRSAPLPEEREVVASWRPASSPLVSVLCTTFNHRDYLEDAFRGFLLQRTTFPFEVLVHDDASTDGTADVVRAYAARYPRLFRPTLQSTNQYSRGHRAFHLASAGAKGRLVALCEGDDFWIDPAKLQLQADEFLRDEAVTLVHSDYFRLDAATISATRHPFRKRPPSSRDEAVEVLLRKNVVITATSMYRADVFGDVFSGSGLLRREWPFSDYVLALHAACRGTTVFLARPTAVYRRVPGSITNRGWSMDSRMEAAAHECRASFLAASGLPDRVQGDIAVASLGKVLKMAALAGETARYRVFEEELKQRRGSLPAALRFHRFLLLRFPLYLAAIRRAKSLRTPARP